MAGQVFEYYVEMQKGMGQGVLNVINGIQDIAIDTANLAIGVSRLFTGRLDFSPTFNSPDWRRKKGVRDHYASPSAIFRGLLRGRNVASSPMMVKRGRN